MKAIDDTELSKNKVIKKRTFPIRKDYEKYFGESDIWEHEEKVQQIHKHWHGRGQNGCVFAQHLAKESDYNTGWYSHVFLDNIHDEQKLVNTIEEAIENPEIEVLSLLYPNITTIEQLSSLVKMWITKSRIISLENAIRFKDRICLSLRIELGNSGISSWLMMFAPFKFFPNTRQSPITELSIRVNPKPDEIYPKLSQDRKKAHLADTPFFLPETIVDSTWNATFRNTEYLLGHKPDLISAAKTTISFEIDTWEKFFGELNIKILDFEDEEIQYI